MSRVLHFAAARRRDGYDDYRRGSRRRHVSTVITGVAAFVTIATVVLPWLCDDPVTLLFLPAFGAAVSTVFVSSPLNSCFSALRKRLNRPGWASCVAAALSLFAVATPTAGSTRRRRWRHIWHGRCRPAPRLFPSVYSSAYSSSEGSAIGTTRALRQHVAGVGVSSTLTYAQHGIVRRFHRSFGTMTQRTPS